MSSSGARAVIGWLLTATAGTAAATTAWAAPSGLVVHEWGTFTAVAGADGAPVVWHPLDGASDLPAFVYGADHLQDGLRGTVVGKGPAPIRMETPVVYFYTDGTEPQAVNLSVRFVDGAITEWYPRLTAFDGATADWGTFLVVPRSPASASTLPHDGRRSHYYPARSVDAATVQVCDPRGTEREQFLFYRGIGDFPLGVRAVAGERDLRLWTTGVAPDRVLVYERSGDRVGFALVHPGGGDDAHTVARPTLDRTVREARAELGELLVEAGLYPREADAMLATWQDDWFEPGLRVVYVVPRAETDARLVMTVDPVPDALVRVLVGRLEVPTPDDGRALSAILARDAPDAAVLADVSARFGRFAEPWLVGSGLPRAERLLAGIDRTTTVGVR